MKGKPYSINPRYYDLIKKAAQAEGISLPENNEGLVDFYKKLDATLSDDDKQKIKEIISKAKGDLAYSIKKGELPLRALSWSKPESLDDVVTLFQMLFKPNKSELETAVYYLATNLPEKLNIDTAYTFSKMAHSYVVYDLFYDENDVEEIDKRTDIILINGIKSDEDLGAIGKYLILNGAEESKKEKLVELLLAYKSFAKYLKKRYEPGKIGVEELANTLSDYLIHKFKMEEVACMAFVFGGYALFYALGTILSFH